MPISTTFDPSAPAARTGTGSAINNREDLSDALTLLAPKATPMLSMMPKLGKMESTFSEWPIDKLSSPSDTGVAEGADVTAFADKFENQARLGNYPSILRRPWLVSKVQEAVKKAGKADKAQAVAKCVLEIKRDIEKRIGSDNDRSVENGSDTVYGFRGLGDWIDSAGPSDVPAAYRTPAASILTAAPTENTLGDVITSIYTVNGSENRLNLFAGTALRRTVSKFTRTSSDPDDTVLRVTHESKERTLVFTIDTFQSDHGLVNIVNANSDCVVNSNRGYLLNMDFVGIKDLLPLNSFDLPDQGGGPRGYVEWAGTLVCKHPGAHGKIAY